ncbi:hypothetical protein [Luteolibacter soli]|uniref:Uncharacterized protein n=1 Tax=Luteolibacter soli TaxID=3135280 RepID=A0ABU9AV05_9BACT
MAKALLLAGSHLLCIVAGGYALNAATSPRTPHDSGMAPTKSSNRSGHEFSSASAAHTLATEAITASHAPLFDVEEAQRAAKIFAKGEGEKRVRELTADGKQQPTDPAEFAAAMLAWFRDDLKAAFDFMQAAGAGTLYDAVLVQALKSASLEDHLKLAKTLLESPAIFRVGEIMGMRLAEMNPAEAAAFFKQSGIMQERALLQTMIRGWPEDQVPRFLDMAMAVNDPALFQAFLKSTNPRKQAALLFLLDSRADSAQAFPWLAELPAELRGHLYRYADPSVPLDERIAQMKNLAWLKDATPEALREGALKQISTVDIHELMKSGPDYRYAFRHGAMTADEILTAVKEQFPELAAASEYETRVRVFNELASEDAQGAFSLISNLPEEQRNLAVIHQSRWSFRDNTPEAFYSMIDLAPGPDSAEAAPARADAWNSYGQRAYREYGSDYIDWVRELPAGVNRDAARASLAALLKRNNQADLAKEFEAP